MAVGTTAYPTSLDTVVELIEAANNSTTTLDGAIDNSVTTIPVVSTASFPSSGTISIDSEIISYTGKTGASFTGCTRGFESTSAASHLNGATVDGEITARHHNVLASALIAVETKLGSGTAIAVNKLAALTASRAVVTDASGFISAATVTAAELGYLSGVTTPTGSGALVLATSPTLTTPTIAKLANLTSNGFVKTSGGDGTLSVDTSTYLTANQTITLSGDVTGSGTTGITATIASGAVTYAKMQNISATSRILGRKTAGAGSTEECTLSEILDFIGSAAQGDILYRGAASWERLGAGTNGHFLKTQGAAANPVWAAVAGGGLGDVVGPGSATDNAVARFDSTTGKLVKNSVVTIADTTGNMAGVGTLNTHTIPGGTDTFVLLAANQTLTTKTLISPDINGGTADSLTSLSVRSTGAAFDLLFANTEVLTGNKTLTVKVNDTSRTVDLGGNLTLAAAFSTSGANALTLTTTGATNVTLPTTGTLVNSAVTSLSSLTTVGTITTGGLGTGAVLGGVTMTLGSDADGDIYYRSSNVLTRLAKGTALQQLRMNAGATAPEWATISGGGGLTIGTTAITSGTAGRFLYETSGNVVGEIAGSSADANGAVQFAATARTSGVAQYFRINTPADTGQTASTESVGMYFGGNGSGSTVTRTWANGAITTQRENVFVAPTYAFVSGSNTITTAATVAITGAPAVGANAAITNPLSLYVQEGLVNIGTTASTDAVIGGVMARGLNVALSSGASPVRFFAGYRSSTDSWVGITDGTITQIWQNDAGNGSNFGTFSNHRLQFRTNNSARITIDNNTNGGVVGINKSSSMGAQLHVVSGSASRVGLRVDSASTPSVDIVQFTNNGTNYWQLGSAGAVTMTSQTANTATVATANTINVNSTGTAAAGFGGQVLYQLETTTTDSQSAAALGWLWTTATHASRTSALTFSTVNNAGALTEIARFSGVAAVFSKGMVYAYVAKTGAYTAAVTDFVIDCTSGTFTVDLPAVSGLTGQTFIIKNSGTGVITLDGSGSETIDGATTQTITAGASLTIMCTGSAWIIL